MTVVVDTPQIIIERDYDDTFKQRVEAAIELNIKNNKEMVSTITINSGPYRSYCMKYDKSEDRCDLDFYSANRRFGFEHSIEDIAGVILK